MKAGSTVLRWTGRDEGANLIEAALLLLLIAVALILVLAWVGDQNGRLWDSVPQAFEEPASTTIPDDDGGSSGGGSSGGGGSPGGGSSGGGSSGGGSDGDDPDCGLDPPSDDADCDEEEEEVESP